MTPKNIVIGQKINPEKAVRAKELRRNMTEAEKILWERLRANRLSGWHFRRQQVIRGFIVDLYCHAVRFYFMGHLAVVEISKIAAFSVCGAIEQDSARFL